MLLCLFIEYSEPIRSQLYCMTGLPKKPPIEYMLSHFSRVVGTTASHRIADQ